MTLGTYLILYIPDKLQQVRMESIVITYAQLGMLSVPQLTSPEATLHTLSDLSGRRAVSRCCGIPASY